MGIIREMELVIPTGDWTSFLIFGLLPNGKLGHEVARGIIRHAWGHLYRHFTRVETDDIMFSAENVVSDTVRTVIAAVRAKAEAIKIKNAYTVASSLEGPPVATKLTTFEPLATVYTDGALHFHDTIREAIQHFSLH